MGADAGHRGWGGGFEAVPASQPHPCPVLTLSVGLRGTTPSWAPWPRELPPHPPSCPDARPRPCSEQGQLCGLSPWGGAPDPGAAGLALVDRVPRLGVPGLVTTGPQHWLTRAGTLRRPKSCISWPTLFPCVICLFGCVES